MGKARALAHEAPGLIKSAIGFRFKRRELRRKPLDKIDTIIVDMDHTLLKEHALRQTLISMYGNKGKGIKGVKKYNEIMVQIKNGEIPFEEGIVIGNEMLKEFDFRQDDWKKVAKVMMKKGHVRNELVKSLQELQKRGKNVIIATHTAGEMAKFFAEEFGFTAGIGTSQKFDKDGRVISLDTIVSDRKGKDYRGIPLKSKINSIAEAFEDFDPKTTAAIGDDLFEIGTMSGVALGLFTPSEQNLDSTLTKIPKKLKLYDVPIMPDEYDPKLELLLRYPQMASLPEKELNKHIHRVIKSRTIAKAFDIGRYDVESKEGVKRTELLRNYFGKLMTLPRTKLEKSMTVLSKKRTLTEKDIKTALA